LVGSAVPTTGRREVWQACDEVSDCLRKQMGLSVGNLHRSRTLLVIVRHMVDPGVSSSRRLAVREADSMARTLGCPMGYC
jgi:hypothetical protein